MKFFQFIIRYSRIFTLLVIVLPIVAGTVAYQQMPKEGEPEISAPIAIVITPYPGASPSEVESLVTNPLEEALSGLKDVKEVRSSSPESVSVVVVEFDVDADVERSLQKVRDKVTEARSDLPDDADDSSVEEITLSDIPIMIISVVGDIDPIRLKRLTETVADQLDLLPEVLETVVSGGLTREIQIYLDPERLNQYGLTILDVYDAVKRSDVNIPGGMVNTSRRRFLLRTLTEVKRVQDYEQVPLITAGDRVVYLGDVARVVDGHAEDVTYSRVDDRSSVSISVKKRSGANILKTAEKVRQEIKRLEKGFPAGVHTVITADQSRFIQQGFDIMSNSAVTGLLIVIFVLFFAMGLRNSVITSLSIPLSLLLTFVLLHVAGITNNNMVRFALVLCIGMLVDNAIIVVENAYHHYQLGKDRLTAIMDGVGEIALPVISATLTTMAAFLPMLLMTGTTGKYMGFMPKTVTIALLSSLVVALVTSPLILSRFMKQSVKEGRVVSPEDDMRWLKKLYVLGVAWSMNHRVLLALLAVVALAGAGSLLAAGVVSVEMFPDIDFDFIYITIETPPGTEVDETDAVARRVEAIVRQRVPEAVQVVSSVGIKMPSAFEVQVTAGPQSHFAEVTVELKDGHEFKRASHKEIQKRIRPLLDRIPGASITYRPLAWGPPRLAPIVANIYGPDLSVLRRINTDVKSILSAIPGAVEIKDDFTGAPPELRVEVDRAKAASLGVPLTAVATTMRGATAGLDIRDFRDELDVSKKYDLKVRYSPESRTGPEMLDKVRVRSITGALVPLGNFSEFTHGPGLNTIRHVDRRRVVRITAQSEGRSAVEVSKELQDKLASYRLPEGYTFDFSGDFKDTAESFASLKLAYAVAFIIIFTLLVAQFNSFYQPFAIMTALPLSVVGAMIGLLITHNNFSVMSFIGLVGLTGIVVNDSIVLVDCINRNRQTGGNIFDSVVLAGQQRLRPILSTTVTTIGGIITLTITDELWEGLGVVIIFGIGFATILTLVVVPVMYTLFEGLGDQVRSALKGPRFTEPPRGRAFYWTRRRGAGIVLVLMVVLQAGALAVGLVAIAPWLLKQYHQAVLQAPSLTKLAIEALVFYLGLLVQAVAALAVLLTPTWLGLLYLMNRRSADGYFVDLVPEGLALTSPSERLLVPAESISHVRLSRFGRRVVIRAGRRIIRLKRLAAADRTPGKTPLREWLAASAPPRRQVREDTTELFRAIQRLAIQADLKMPEDNGL
ncbi:MAG: efflux RND transporter permease subunit [Proteobacteria bacterium]|nr:efflux RND transporter permease subunit [Pseudomonadota bacterium]